MKYLLLCLCALLASSAHATVIRFVASDIGRMAMSGYVDTETDYAWIESMESTSSLWTPRELPHILEAQDRHGDVYDIPDDWDHSIDDNWSFISTKRNIDTKWAEGESASLLSFGWGGWGFQSAGYVDTSFSEFDFLSLPESNESIGDVTFDNIEFSTVNEPKTKTSVVFAAASLLVLYRYTKR